MLKMQKNTSMLAPRLEEVKKKFANDRARLNQETMKVYREAGVNPTGQMFGCLPMMLQLPIWVALWMSLNNTVELRHAPFMLWIRDLSSPDALIHFKGSYNIPLLSSMFGPVTSFNLLPILQSVFMYLQQRFMSPKTKPVAAGGKSDAAGKATEQMQQQKKMMSVMTLFIGVLFYNMPSGLTMYIMTSSIFGMIEQWRIRQRVHEQEERAATEGPKPPSGKPPGRWQAWLEDLSKRAEQARELRSSKPKKGPPRK
jgi:YidC/Oxa1 family membrane protein insertase